MAGPLVKRFYKTLRIDVKKLDLIIATGDAAKTAQTYGIACAAVADVLELLGQTMHLSYAKNASVTVTPDFVLDKTVMDINITFSFRVRHILALPFGAVADFIKVLIQKL